jgi:putative tricarboxylic transport membrane protein
LMGGFQLTPVMIGMFAVSEVIRYAVSRDVPLAPPKQGIGRIFRGQWTLLRQYKLPVLRGSVLGTLVGALPGTGADIAAWISYGLSKRFSKTPEKFGTGHVEGIIEAGAANNSALAGAWIPALVFGIPGDSITAIVIGVLYLKGMNPGPTIFIENPQNIYAVFIVFFLANLLLLPLGWLAIKTARHVLRVPRSVLMPVILLFCAVGAFAINNSVFDVGVMLAFGLLAYAMEANRFPIAPTILGLVLGGMLEQNFVTSLIKADGNVGAFFARPIAGTLGGLTLLVWASPLLLRWLRRRQGGAAA